LNNLLEKQVFQSVANQFSSKMAKKSQFLNFLCRNRQATMVGKVPEGFATIVWLSGGKPVVWKFVLHGVETEFQTV
jgi:hypothetical protein